MTSGGATRLASSSNVKFPLPDGYFPPVELTPAEIEVYEERVKVIMKNALAEYNLHEAMGTRPEYGSRWTTVGKVEHLTAIREVAPSRAVEASRIFGRIDGDYRNFIDFFYSDSAQQVFAVNQFMYGYAVDAAVLCNIYTKGSNSPHEYLGMKWVCLQPSALSRKHDMCFLEYLVYSKDLQGRDVGVRITLPLLLKECPPLPDKLKTRRINSHTVTIVRPTNDNIDSSEIFMTREVDMNKGSSVSSTAVFKKLMTTLSSMALFADSKHISMHGMLDRSSWTPKKARANCNVCSRKFSATRRRQHCRLCGEVACRRCMTVRAAPIVKGSTSLNARTFQVIKTVFCKACMGRVRDSSMSTSKTADSQDEGVSDAESFGWFEKEFRSRSFDSEYHFTLFNETSLSPAITNKTPSFRLEQDMADDRQCNGTSLSQSSIDLKAQSESETRVSSSLEEDKKAEVTEVDARALIDLRHLRTMAGAERVVHDVEEENLRIMRESLAALDFKAVQLVVSPLIENNDFDVGNPSNRSCILPLMEEIDDEDEDEDDVIEVFGESSDIDSSTRQIVSSPLDETPLSIRALEHIPFASKEINVPIDQRLYEQELLLQRLVMAANSSVGYCPPSVRAHQ